MSVQVLTEVRRQCQVPSYKTCELTNVMRIPETGQAVSIQPQTIS